MHEKEFICVRVVFLTRSSKIMLILGLYRFATVNVCLYQQPPLAPVLVPAYLILLVDFVET
jgi:hypothetical protein